jgi:hypothetical protein
LVGWFVVFFRSFFFFVMPFLRWTYFHSVVVGGNGLGWLVGVCGWWVGWMAGFCHSFDPASFPSAIVPFPPFAFCSSFL